MLMFLLTTPAPSLLMAPEGPLKTFLAAPLLIILLLLLLQLEHSVLLPTLRKQYLTLGRLPAFLDSLLL